MLRVKFSQSAARAFHSSAAARAQQPQAVILSATRTAIGSFRGGLAGVTAPELGATVVRAAVAKAGIQPTDVSEVILGNVIGSNQGQAPARQAAVKGGLPHSVVCTTVNKVCSSGMKSVMYGAMGIQLGHHQTAVTGGFESMSNIPYYVPAMRNGSGYGHTQMVDGILRDGLMDAFDDHHMGNCAEKTAKDYKLTRADQDAYALESYRRASEAQKAGHFKAEITPVELPGAKKGEAPKLFQVDEEPSKLKADKVPTLRPAFLKDGTVTAANSSKLNDGAAALVLSSDAFAASRGLKPLARVVAMADFEHAPIDFPTAPAPAVQLLLKRAGLSVKDIDLFEFNEAFSAVALANMHILKLDPSKVNVWGGAVSLGHPIGCSGARIITTLIHALKARNGKFGVASICNGGGGASSVLIEML